MIKDAEEEEEEDKSLQVSDPDGGATLTYDQMTVSKTCSYSSGGVKTTIQGELELRYIMPKNQQIWC